MKVNVGVSQRHVHLTIDDVNKLFGENYVLTKKADLSQPGQFSCNETVIIKGSKSTIENVRVLGPLRSKTQVEISKTDTFKLGTNPPIRNSGDLDDAGEITIIGPKGSIVKNALIIPTRHLHATYDDAKKYGLLDKKFVTLVVKGEKPGILDNVYIRLDDNFKLEVHLDTDDANAFLIKQDDEIDMIIR